MTIDDAIRRWVSFNDAAGLAQISEAPALLFEQKPSRPRRLSQAYACAKMLHEELGADDAAVLSGIARFFFADDRRGKYGGALNAMDGRLSKAERKHGDALLVWLRSPTRCASHCTDLRREFAGELRLSGNSDKQSQFSDTASSGLCTSDRRKSSLTPNS